MLKAVRLGGVDITDTPHDFAAAPESGALEIELTTRVTRVGGTVVDDGGRPINDYVVVVFAERRELWTPFSRFIRVARANQDGRFVIEGLPPGRYLAAGVASIQRGSEGDPEVLEWLRRGASSFT